AETLSRIVDWSDRKTCVLFADGAGAVVLKPSEEPGIITTLISADGQYKDLLLFPYGPSSGFDKLRGGVPGGITMKGNEVFKVAVNTLSKLVDRTLAKGGVAVSIDTRKAAVMEAALAAGATIVNDISALRYDERAMEVVVKAGCPVVLMHAPSAKSDPHEGGGYAHVLFDVYDMLAERVAACKAAGIDPAKIIVDPGLGFGKGVADNLALINGIALFHTLGCPILFGASRKRMIGALDNEAPADQRLGGSVALHYQAASQGAQLLRVHDVAENRQALRVWRGLRDAALTA
ncbi:MAG: dihydropteroate synthase, partial [Sphingopyxis sp.]|nr:dihydropteroate synthase [Sphingopyxis sp.]